MSKKIFFIVLTCCLLVATFCVSFAGAPQVQSAPADIRAVLDRPDCASAPLIVPPVVEPPLSEVVSLEPTSTAPWDYIYLDDYSDLSAGYYSFDYSIGDIEDIVIFSALNDALPSPTFSFVSFGNIEIDIPFSTFVLYNSTFEGLAVDCDNQVIYLTPVGSGEEISLPFDTDSTSFGFVVRVYDSFRLLDGDDSVIEASVDRQLLVGLQVDFSYITSPIFTTLVSGLRALGTNVGRAFSTMANAIFINTDGTGLSTFGILVVVFAAVSLGLSLTRWVLNFCGSWGKRNR